MNTETRVCGVITAVTVLLCSGLPGAKQSAATETTDDVLSTTAATGGLVVHLGCGGGALTEALATNSRCRIHGLESQRDHVLQARERLAKRGLGARVHVDRWIGSRLPYADNLVNVVVAENPGDVSSEEIRRVLVPRGVMYVKVGEAWEKTVKPWPQQIDQWTHWSHGPDGNAVAHDTLVGPPRRMQWVAGPLWSRSHDSVPSVTSWASANGRVIYIVDEAPASMAGSAPDKWALVARDAFNGLKLWRKPIAEWGWRSWATQSTCRFTIPTHMPRRLVAVGDRVYTTLGFNAPLVELDAASGEVLRTFPGTEFTDEILCLDGMLVIAVNKGRQGPGVTAKDSPPPVCKFVAAMDVESGQLRWKTGDYVGLRSKTGRMERISHLSMVAGGGKVFFVDGDQIIGLNLADGRVMWQVARPAVSEHKMRYDIRITDMSTLVYHEGMLYFAQLNPDKRIDWREIRGRLHCLAADSGKEVWSRECSSWGWAHPADVFVLNGLVWASGYKDDYYYGLDLTTGEVRRKVSNHAAFDHGHHHRCYPNKATSRFLMTSFRGLEFIDLATQQTDQNHWVRGTCRLGAFPCNGMVYSTPHPCDCYISSKLNGFLALAPQEPAEDERTEKDAPRLVRGPAFDAAGAATSSTKNVSGWPTYRGNAGRNGSTTEDIPAALRPAWSMNLGGALTGPVAAHGLVIVARKENRELVALRAADGSEAWRTRLGGRLDTPPTIDGQRVVCGCSDGYVYCLRASDGQRIWRFRAAPRDRLVGAFDGIESAWPVHGSVLVQDGIAYFTAGRSSFLDGGIDAWALEMQSGKVVTHERIGSDYGMKVDWGRDQSEDTGTLSDLLVAHRGGIYLRQKRLFGKGEDRRTATHFHATGGLLDNSWFHRTRWFLGGAPVAEYFVFNDDYVCGVRARKGIGGYGLHFSPGGKGFVLFAADRVNAAPRRPATRTASPDAKRAKPTAKKSGRPQGKSETPKVRQPVDRWAQRISIRATAMAIANDTLIVAGCPDAIDDNDPWAAYEGRKGGKLLTVSLVDGTKQFELDLSSPPVLDGIAVAEGRLIVATCDGRIVCLTQK